MPKNTICVNKDYSENKNNYSLKSLQWITYLEKLHNTVIQSAFGGKEVTINIDDDIYKVDGYDKGNKIIYEFHGCYYHGCQKCYCPTDKKKMDLN